MTERILIVDSDDAARESLELILAGGEVEVQSATSGEAALERIESSAVDVVLCELHMGGLDGLDLLPQISRRLPGVAIILTSEGPGDELASEAMRRGAYDSIVKPFAPQEIQLRLRRARERAQLRRTSQLLQRDVLRAAGEPPIVAASPPMIELLELLEQTASFKTPALLTGESGTEKEALARAIHAQSARRNGPFVAVTCSSNSEAPNSEARLECDLFGHAKGAFEGADQAARGLFVDADGGSIFLDAVDGLSPSLQRKLLHVLQTEEVLPLGESKARRIDVRVMAATTRDLSADSQSGRFQADLFDRLKAMHLYVPALRERRQDIPLLVDHFMARFAEILGGPPIRIADDALERLAEYSWPGNVRELENVVERAMIRADDDRITLRQLPADVVAARRGGPASGRSHFSLKQARRVAEAEVIERALSATKGNRTHAAKLLEISHRALLYKIKDYQIRN